MKITRKELKLLSSFTGTDITRPQYHSVIIDGNQAVATDGMRIVVINEKDKVENPYIVPISIVKLMLKNSESTEFEVYLDDDKGAIIRDMNGLLFACPIPANQPIMEWRKTIHDIHEKGDYLFTDEIPVFPKWLIPNAKQNCRYIFKANGSYAEIIEEKRGEFGFFKETDSQHLKLGNTKLKIAFNFNFTVPFSLFGGKWNIGVIDALSPIYFEQENIQAFIMPMRLDF